MFPSKRVLTPEILDSLDAGHPEALRSRRDLRRLDGFLGGSGWILRSVLERSEEASAGIVELGAGEGLLCAKLSGSLSGSLVTGLDRAPRPSILKPCVKWRSGDFFQTLPGTGGGIAVGSLILHHFSTAELGELGKMLASFRVLIFSEPWRTRGSLWLSRLANPFVGPVTRHDMAVSIRAGFQKGELGPLLGLDPSIWKVSEAVRMSGILRFKAWRE
jgi:hypothetical protein